jgi:hypothetical protein
MYNDDVLGWPISEFPLLGDSIELGGKQLVITSTRICVNVERLPQSTKVGVYYAMVEKGYPSTGTGDCLWYFYDAAKKTWYDETDGPTSTGGKGKIRGKHKITWSPIRIYISKRLKVCAACQGKKCWECREGIKDHRGFVLPIPRKINRKIDVINYCLDDPYGAGVIDRNLSPKGVYRLSMKELWYMVNDKYSTLYSKTSRKTLKKLFMGIGNTGDIPGDLENLIYGN